MIRTAVILAAGLGSRLKDKTKDKPKAFLEIGGQTLIERSIDNLLAFGIERIIIGTGYLNQHFDALKNNYPEIETYRNPDFANTGSMYTLYNLRGELGEPFLLLEADLLYEQNALKYLIDSSYSDVILASGTTHSNDEVYIEADDKGFLVNMSKDKQVLKHISGELVGISKVSEAAFEKMCSYASHYYDANDRSIHYEDDFVGISQHTAIHILKIENLAWCEIDDAEHLNRAVNETYPLIVVRDA